MYVHQIPSQILCKPDEQRLKNAVTIKNNVYYLSTNICREINTRIQIKHHLLQHQFGAPSIDK